MRKHYHLFIGILTLGYAITACNRQLIPYRSVEISHISVNGNSSIGIQSENFYEDSLVSITLNSAAAINAAGAQINYSDAHLAAIAPLLYITNRSNSTLKICQSTAENEVVGITLVQPPVLVFPTILPAQSTLVINITGVYPREAFADIDIKIDAPSLRFNITKGKTSHTYDLYFQDTGIYIDSRKGVYKEAGTLTVRPQIHRPGTKE